MSTLEITATQPAARVPVAVRAAQLLLLVPLGALVVFGSIYFGVIEPERDPGAVDWLVGSWALVLGLGNIAVGFKLSSGRRVVRRAALTLIACHLLFGVVKIVGYGESEAATFMLLDVLTIGLLSTGAARRLAHS